jgi:hypothetical protein
MTTMLEATEYREAGTAPDRDLSPRAQARAAGLEWDSSGWLIHRRRYKIAGLDESLSAHAQWAGPTKVVRSGRRWSAVTEVYAPPRCLGDPLLDDQAGEKWELLWNAFNENVLGGTDAECCDAWEPPDAESLQQWLATAGHTATVDQQEQLRLTLKSRGCDGQVLVERRPGRLRFSMRLGLWEQLDPASELAILALAQQCNDACRFVRIGWVPREESRLLEAQVDLTGLPMTRAWSQMAETWVCAASDALQLALRRLGLEIEVLADPANHALAKEVVRRTRRNTRRPK